jgi:phosphohistidine phosphatase SixA
MKARRRIIIGLCLIVLQSGFALVLLNAQENTPESPLATLYEPQALIEQLRSGGYVLFFRHALTEERQDSAELDLTHCWTQRNLSAEGQVQAQEVGEAVIQLGIPIGSLYSSPYCRTIETAELMFAEEEVNISYDLISAEFPRINRDTLLNAFRRLVNTLPMPVNANTILVGHVFNLRESTGISVSENGTAIFEPLDHGRYQLIAQISPDEWLQMAEMYGS